MYQPYRAQYSGHDGEHHDLVLNQVFGKKEPGWKRAVAHTRLAVAAGEPRSDSGWQSKFRKERKNLDSRYI